MAGSRLSQTFTISLPKHLAEEVDRVAAAENRSRSELLREAFRQYVERRRRWDRLFEYAEKIAAADDIEEQHVAEIVETFRHSRKV